MAGRPPKVDHLREAFLSSTQSAEGFVNSVLSLSGINPNTTGKQLHVEHARRAVELAFLGVVASWEEFLEQTFVRYMMGVSTDSGFSPHLRLGNAASIAHAYHVLSGDPDYDPNRHFSRFGDPRWVIASSKLYFEQGSPYATRMQPRIEVLQYAVKLRNRVAHSSTKVRSDFKAVAQTHLGLVGDQPLAQGYRVGDLLVTPVTKLFGASAKDRGLNYFSAYVEMYRTLANGIVPR
jgi:hypothetical protein